MGNESSRPLAIRAMAGYMTLSKSQVIELRDSCAPLASWNHTISRKFFQIAVAKAKIPEKDDGHILDLLFTMFDQTGADRIAYRTFCAGISPLACPGESLSDILTFALEVMDLTNFGRIDSAGLKDVIEGINVTAAYLGDDPVLTPKQIRRLAASIFSEHKHYLDHKVCAQRLTEHSLVQRFLVGNCKPQVKFKEDLEEHRESPEVETYFPDEPSLSETDDETRDHETRLPMKSPMYSPMWSPMGSKTDFMAPPPTPSPVWSTASLQCGVDQASLDSSGLFSAINSPKAESPKTLYSTDTSDPSTLQSSLLSAGYSPSTRHIASRSPSRSAMKARNLTDLQFSRIF